MADQMEENTNLSLKETITNAMKTAMREQDKARLGTIRMALAAIKQKEVDERITLEDTQIIDVLTKMVKQRMDAAKQYQEANRTELADKELAEIKHLEAFLPQKLTTAEIHDLIKQVMAEFGSAVSMRDMGKIMAELKKQMAGRADMAEVSKLVRTQLA